MSDKIPYCDFMMPYTDTSTDINTVGDLRRLIADAPDDMEFILYVGDTRYQAEGEIKTQQCIEQNGKLHDETGLVIQVRG